VRVVWRCAREGSARLITLVDDNEGVKLGPVVLAAAAAVAVASAGALSAVPTRPHCRGGVLHRVGTPTASYAAIAWGAVQVYRKAGAEPLARFSRLNENGYPTTFWIVGAIVSSSCSASWYRVELPMRPNGTKGYVRPADVLVRRVTTKIEVDVSARRLTLYRAGKVVLTTKVAVGSPATPTPIGRYYVDQRLVAADPHGPYGPAALGVSAFSNVLTGWAQGGPIGIHGTNEPWSIGRAVSNGCIRVPNATLRRLFAAAGGGTPVVIHP
jgi:lipoprotein-anchoring transpeptidase ErfK/SrfK